MPMMSAKQENTIMNDMNFDDLDAMLASLTAAEAAETAAEMEEKETFRQDWEPDAELAVTDLLSSATGADDQCPASAATSDDACVRSGDTDGGAVPDQPSPEDNDVAAAPLRGSQNAEASVPFVPSVPETAEREAAVSAPGSSMPDGYALFDDGIYLVPTSESSDPVFLCTPLRVDAVFSDGRGTGRGKLVSVKDGGYWRNVTISAVDLISSPAKVIATLVDHGLQLGRGKKAREVVIELLRDWSPALQLQSTRRSGWVDGTCTSFVLGEALIGRGDILPLVPVRNLASGLRAAGTAESWKQDVAALCVDNPLMILATSLAFTGPLLAPMGQMGGGLHFRGTSSSGKTTLLHLATSVWGDSRLISQWNATQNGLEGMAATLNDTLLPLDEIGEIYARDLEKSIYMLANGTGRARMTKDAALADQSQWHLALISSGEISVAEKLGRLTMEGHEVRLIDIEADGRTHGAFDNLHGEGSGAAFSERIKRAARQHHGAIGTTFIEKLMQGPVSRHVAGVRDAMARDATSMLSALPAAADGPTARVANRFALIGAVGALATQMGLTGWAPSAAPEAAAAAFRDWYDRRYDTRREAADAPVVAVKNFLDANWAALTPVTPGATSSLGWRTATQALLPPATWAGLFPAGDGEAAARALAGLQMLLPGEEGRLMRRSSLKIPGRPRLYTVNVDRVMAYRPE